ncbi:MAG: hypothetical protein IMW85_06485 [Thermicanus sp.]|nr:hypothetical protein [Thermicanus sp.]
MIEVHSPLIGKVFDFESFQDALEKLGFSKNETYTYTYAAFDLPIFKSKIEEDYYIRIFVDAVEGMIEKRDCKVQVNEIQIFKAKYHRGIFNEDEVPKAYVKKAEEILQKVHERLNVPAELTMTEK